MILRVDLTVPKAGAYVVAAQRIPSEWLAITNPNLEAFAKAHPGWCSYQSGGMASSWLGGARMIREAEVLL